MLGVHHAKCNILKSEKRRKKPCTRCVLVTDRSFNKLLSTDSPDESFFSVQLHLLAHRNGSVQPDHDHNLLVVQMHPWVDCAADFGPIGRMIGQCLKVAFAVEWVRQYLDQHLDSVAGLLELYECPRAQALVVSSLVS